ncbi:MAG: elongation factor G [Ignavibacteria bacterium]|jgi:elongation factor G|nr:elongation factor G [Ignavibacteria bacterium]
MKVYEPSKIRNVAITGHAGSGKTSFVEAMLFKAGAISRKGAVEDGNTVSDHIEIEQERHSSIYSAITYAEYNDTKINIIDTPGYDDYIGEMLAPVHVSDICITLFNAQNKVEVGAELAYTYSGKMNKPAIFVINKLDGDQANFNQIVEDIHASLTNSAKVVQFPVKQGNGFNAVVDIIQMKKYDFDANGNATSSDIPADLKTQADKYRSELVESIAETDEEMMQKYFDAGEFTDDELLSGFKQGVNARSIIPIFCASSKNNVGISTLLDFIIGYMPAPCDLPVMLENGETIACDVKKGISMFIYKIYSDKKLGDMTYFRVQTGKLAQSMDLVIEGSGKPERIGQLFVTNGKNRVEVSELLAGDIGATVKLKTSEINNTLHEKNATTEYKRIMYPNSKVRLAIVPKTKGEEEKVGTALHAMHNTDPTVVIEHSQELRQTIVYCQGELHSGIIKYRLLNRFGVEAEYIDARVPYRETIQKMANSSYRHKKQSGGAGQFAEVHMRIEPYTENAPNPGDLTVRGRDLIPLDWGGHLEYVNCIVGGVIDARFMPAILKGIMEKMQVGPLTGSYVRDVRVYVYDGKMHPVDSNENAFKIAGTMAFKDCFTQAAPKILEPIYAVYIKVPSDFIGDIMSDLPSRRGVILGSDSEGSYQRVKARMPLAELDKYSTALRSMTQARATFSSEFLEYASVPPNVQAELIDAYKKISAEEE